MTTKIVATEARLSGEVWHLLDAISELSRSPLNLIAESLRTVIQLFYRCSALVIFTEDCTGRPQKKSGAEDVINLVTISELDCLRSVLVDEKPVRTTAQIGGGVRDILAMTYQPTKALLVLIEPAAAPGSLKEGEAIHLLTYLWRLVARRIQERVSDAPPAYLVESRAASAERLRVTAELVDQHSTTLETVLAALRSSSMNDQAARAFATDLTVKALVELRTHNDRTSNLVEEPVATAFKRLRDDLRPLMRLSDIDIQFIEPPAGGRALPGEVAHAARAVVRGLVLAIAEQADVHRIRARWDCDGENLLIYVRDDGRGELTRDAPNIQRLQQRVHAMNGIMDVDIMPGWGADVSVSLPLDAPATPPGDAASWNLGARELEVLQLLTAGQRNRSIAGTLNISENTVKYHIRNLFRKLNVSSRTEAISMAHSAGIR